MWYSKEVWTRSTEIETAKAPSKPRKDWSRALQDKEGAWNLGKTS